MMSFMVADFALLPDSLHHVYLVSRLYMQLPIMLVFTALTFTPFYARIHHHVLWLSVLGITYANYWLTVQCWLIAEFSFPYEGLLLYALFATFILRLSFKYSIVYCCLSLAGFCFMVSMYPMYAELTGVNIGFVTLGLSVILLGVHRIEQTFAKLKVASDQLLVSSQTDHLTGINNRGAFDARFSKVIKHAQTSSTSISVFMVDLDNFKDYNDGFGHLKGDEVIKLQADILTEVFISKADLIARYGGEEFLVACVDSTNEQCEHLAQQIIDKWQQISIPHASGQGAEHISCSIGLYHGLVDANETIEQVLDKADKALYQAKADGRARFVNYNTLKR